LKSEKPEEAVLVSRVTGIPAEKSIALEGNTPTRKIDWGCTMAWQNKRATCGASGGGRRGRIAKQWQDNKGNRKIAQHKQQKEKKRM